MRKKSASTPVPATLEELLAQVRLGRLSRRRFLTSVAAAGASATALATLAAALNQIGHASTPAHPSGQSGTEQQNLQLHQKHVAQQQQRLTPTPRSEAAPGGPLAVLDSSPAASNAHIEQMVQKLMEDYHEDAVVEDMLMPAPIVGREAIANRKRAEFLGISGAEINILQRFAMGDQVIAEWIVTGTHTGDLWGFPATDQAIQIRGLTAVTRRDGKITKESLYYDADEVRRQLTRVS